MPFLTPLCLNTLGNIGAIVPVYSPMVIVLVCLHSTDLVHWQELGGAMPRLPNDWPYYWAPEVVYANGKFYLYYSVGDEVNMQMRVAVATHPAGPFVDSGHRLTQEKFAIDGHVLVDDDGKRYLFYATDFLEHTFVGTGTMRDLLLDPFTLAGQPRPVTLPRYDWHVYDPNRAEKGGSALAHHRRLVRA